MATTLDRVVDALDVETFLVCETEDEGRSLAVQLVRDLGFRDVDLVFAEFMGHGIRVRVRAYVQRPGDLYPWLPGGGASAPAAGGPPEGAA